MERRFDVSEVVEIPQVKNGRKVRKVLLTIMIIEAIMGNYINAYKPTLDKLAGNQRTPQHCGN